MFAIRTVSSVILLALGAATCASMGCIAEPLESEAEEPVASAEQEIMYAPTTKSFAGSVLLYTGSSFCSGTMLTEHWVLTAAHCLTAAPAGGPGNVWYASASDGLSVMAYSGPVEMFKHPSYSGGKKYDIGLVHLMSYGVDTTVPDRARLSTSVPSLAHFAGWGRGGDAVSGASKDCANATSLYTHRWTANSTNGSGNGVVYSSDERLCDGDSGSPYMRQVSSAGQYKYLQFAVHHGDWWDPFDGTEDVGALISSSLAWIEQKVQSRIPYLFNYVKLNESFGGYPFTRYLESGILFLKLKIGDNLCLDAQNVNAASPTVLETCNGSQSQSWHLKPSGEIRNLGNYDMCLDVTGGSAASGTPMAISPCAGATAQRFRLTSDGSLHVGVDHKKCVDVPWSELVPGASPWVWDCNGSPAQIWSATP